MTSSHPVKPNGRSSLPWHRDPAILARLDSIQRLLDEGYGATNISRRLGLSYERVREDIRRIEGIWRQRAAQQIEARRSTKLRRLDTVIHRAFVQMEEDRKWNMAVLFDLPYITECPGGVVHRLGEPEPLPKPDPEKDVVVNAMLEQVFGVPAYGNPGQPCPGPHLCQYRVWRDAHGAAEYRTNPAQHLEVIRKALMDQAKLEGLIVDRVSATDAQGNDLASTLRGLLERHAARTIDVTPVLPVPEEDDAEEPPHTNGVAQ